MKRYLLTAVAVLLALSSCRDTNAPQAGNQTDDNDAAAWNGYRPIDPSEIQDNVIDLIHEQWMLITAGTQESYNTMTASWGAMGCIWSRPVSLITVNNTRYTYEFLQEHDTYTLSFFDEEYKPALVVLGTKSGRDGDKVSEAGLTPIATPAGSMSFSEARMIIECAKLYEDSLNPRSIFDDEIASDYIRTPGEFHQLFIGEILSVWVK